MTGVLLFLAIAAPWHILAGLRNPDQGNPVGNIPTPGHVHGFFYFYFINEHVLRFLGKRYPHDYNKQPGWVSGSGKWSGSFPGACISRCVVRAGMAHAHAGGQRTSADSRRMMPQRLRSRTHWLLSLYAGFMLVFFSISTNQEYYTFPAYLPLLMLTAGRWHPSSCAQSASTKRA